MGPNKIKIENTRDHSCSYSNCISDHDLILYHLLNVFRKNANNLNLPYLLHQLSERIGKKPKRKQVVRVLQELEDQGYIDQYRKDGLIWIMGTEALARDYVDLITELQNSNHILPKTKKRNESWRYARNVLKYKTINQKGWSLINSEFKAYLDETKQKFLVFKRIDDARDEYGEELKYVVKRYEHRFMDKRLKKIRVQYDSIFKNSLKFNVGIHLVLTIDPKKHKNLEEMDAMLPILWKRFDANIRKILKKRNKKLVYLRVLEFQDSGRAHFHVLLFGVGRLLDKKTQLTPLLDKIGFGKINYIYKINKRNNKWVWAKGKPKDAGSAGDIGSYLEKYLKKAVNFYDSGEFEYDEINKLALYWLYNKRFYTCSQILLPKKDKKSFIKVGVWVYIGCWNIYEVPDGLYYRIFNQLALMFGEKNLEVG